MYTEYVRYLIDASSKIVSTKREVRKVKLTEDVPYIMVNI